MRRLLAIVFALALSLFLCSCEQADKTQEESVTEATVIYVVDGDTLCVQRTDIEGPSKVRLIGINTPESVAPQEYLDETGQENTQEGVDASDYVKSILKDGDVIYLQFDTDEEDKYGRTLAYVWLEKPASVTDENEIKAKMLNAILLERGYAEVMTVKPNTTYASLFEKLAA